MTPRRLRCVADHCGAMHPEPIPCCLKHWHQLPVRVRERVRDEYLPGVTNEEQPSPHWPRLLSAMRARIADIARGEP